MLQMLGIFGISVYTLPVNMCVCWVGKKNYTGGGDLCSRSEEAGTKVECPKVRQLVLH